MGDLKIRVALPLHGPSCERGLNILTQPLDARAPGPTGWAVSRQALPPQCRTCLWGYSFNLKDNHGVSPVDTFLWSTKQCTFYCREPLGMTPAFRISSSPGSDSDKLGELKIDYVLGAEFS